MTSFIVTAAEDAEAWVLKEAKAVAGAVEGVVINDVAPALETFGAQFATDFGAAALKLGAAFVTNLLNKTTTIATAAPQLVQTIINTGIQIAGQDALTVAGNALRVLLPVPVVQAPAAATPNAPTP